MTRCTVHPTTFLHHLSAIVYVHLDAAFRRTCLPRRLSSVAPTPRPCKMAYAYQSVGSKVPTAAVHALGLFLDCQIRIATRPISISKRTIGTISLKSIRAKQQR